MNGEAMLSMSREVDALSNRYPIGTPCRYWPGARWDEPRHGTIRSRYAVLGGHTVVVWVTGYPGCIAASHVEPEPPAEVVDTLWGPVELEGSRC